MRYPTWGKSSFQTNVRWSGDGPFSTTCSSPFEMAMNPSGTVTDRTVVARSLG